MYIGLYTCPFIMIFISKKTMLISFNHNNIKWQKDTKLIQYIDEKCYLPLFTHCK